MSVKVKPSYIPINEIETYVFQEHINKINLKIIISKYQDIEGQISQSRLNQINRTYRELYGNSYNLLATLKTLYKNLNYSDINSIRYNRSKYLKTLGRLFANAPSLQSIPREIRAILAKDKYNDVDLENCHFNLAYQHCEKNKIYCPYLTDYAKNRNEIIERLKNKNPNLDIDYKNLFLTLLNGGEREGLKITLNDDFINSFTTEINNIHSCIFDLPNNKELKKSLIRRKKDDDYNIKGSLFNIILCEIENTIILHATSFLKSYGFNVDVLIFDGFMVRIDNDNVLNEEILRNLEDYIYDTLGYKLKFIIKPFDNTINLEKYKTLYDEGIIKKDDTYNKDKSLFEENHIKIIHPPLYLTIYPNKIEMQSENEIIQSYKHQKTTIKTEEGILKDLNFIKTWLNDDEIRRRENLDFIPPPLICPSNTYNTWRDFELNNITIDITEEKKNEYITKIKDYINNLVGCREKYTNYILSWIANIIQTPANRSQVCIVLYCEDEGGGKTMLCEFIAKILDENKCFFITDLENQLFGKHSLAEMNKLLIVLNEIKGKDTYLNHDKFKSRITETKRDYEPKGLKAFEGTNYCTYIASTNNPNCIPLNDKQRRFMPITCNNPKINDKQYFLDFLKNVVENVEARKVFFDYLKTFNIEEHIPDKLFQKYILKDDPLYKNLTEYNKPIELDFLEHFLNNNSDYNDCSQSLIKITKADLYDKFNFYIKRFEEKAGTTIRKFNLNFIEKVINKLNKIEGFNDMILYSTNENPIRVKNEHAYIFNLDLLRKYFSYEDE